MAIHEINHDDMVSWKCGEASDELSDVIENELKTEGSFARKWNDDFHRRLTNPEQIDWLRVLLLDEEHEIAVDSDYDGIVTGRKQKSVFLSRNVWAGLAASVGLLVVSFLFLQRTTSINDLEDQVVNLSISGELSGLEEYSTESQSGVQKYLKEREFPRADIWIQLSDTTRGDDTEDQRWHLYPVRTAIEELQPVFRWKSFADCTKYKIVVYANGEIVTDSEQETGKKIQGTAWQSSKLLQRGQIYSWRLFGWNNKEQLKVPKDAHKPNRFFVATENALAQIKQAKDNGASHLVLLHWYVSHGLRENALRELSILRSKNADKRVLNALENSLNSL